MEARHTKNHSPETKKAPSTSRLLRIIRLKLLPSSITFIRNYRIHKAAHLILALRIDVKEAAYTVGFDDFQYFKNYFKKQYNTIKI